MATTTKGLRVATGARTVALNALELEYGEFKNPRTFSGLETADIRELATSIWDDGLLTPLLIQQFEDEEGVVHEVVDDGGRRCRALRYLADIGWIAKDEPIPVNDLGAVKKATAKAFIEAIEHALTTGVQRVGLSSYELVEAAADLTARDPKRSQEDIAKTIGRSPSWLSRMLKAWKTSTPDLRESFKSGKITDEQFKELATVKAPEQPAAVKEIVEVRERGERAIARAASKEKAAANSPPPKSRSSSAEPAKNDIRSMRTGNAGQRVPEAAASKIQMTVGQLADLVDLGKKFPVPGATSTATGNYVQGALDMAKAIVSGDLSRRSFRSAWDQWLRDAQKAMQKSNKPAPKKPLTFKERVAKAEAKDKAEAKAEKPPKATAATGAISKACNRRHHGECKQDVCGCPCHAKK